MPTSEIQKQRVREWKAKNPEKIKEYGRKKRLNPKTNAMARVYHKAKRERMAGREKPEFCEVCGSGGKIVYDHCHTSNLFRGWICDRCNVTLGMARDNPENLRKLADYLESHNRGLTEV